MKQTITELKAPMALISINKSKPKTYYNNELPTFYLEKDSEFQIELFNPTNKTIHTKIRLNNNQISQGGLILKPREKVFIEKYLDIPNKFKFNTYNVDNTDEIKKAIEDNGKLKVDFYNETTQIHQYINSISKTIMPFIHTNFNNSITTTTTTPFTYT